MIMARDSQNFASEAEEGIQVLRSPVHHLRIRYILFSISYIS